MEDGGSQRGATELYDDAKKVCEGCEVKAECLEVGMVEFHFGVFGGTTPKERRDIRAAANRRQPKSSVAV